LRHEVNILITASEISVFIGLHEILSCHDPQSFPLTFTSRKYRDNNLSEETWAETVLDAEAFSWLRSSAGLCLYTVMEITGRHDDSEEPIFPSMATRITGVKEAWRPRPKDTIDMNFLWGPPVQYMVEDAVWKSIMTRRSLRPVDTVLSAMGLFDMTLDPEIFRDLKYPRLASTILLAHEYLKRGGRAFWLTFSLTPIVPERQSDGQGTIRPNRSDGRMCTMPLMMEDEGEQDAEPYQASPFDLSGQRYFLQDAPQGSMDSQGYLNMSSMSLFVAAGETLQLGQYESIFQ